MPTCPNCGTWNPEDKQVCWRCQTPLPKSEPKKKPQRKNILGLPLWLWVLFALLFLLNMLWPLLGFVGR